MLTSCEKYIDQDPNFFIELVPVLYSQVQQLPTDFFIDKISNSNFIRSCLINFFEICDAPGQCGERKKVSLRAEKLRTMFYAKFPQLPPEEMEDDEAPQIVTDFDFVQI